jgi:hypothetical protein
MTSVVRITPLITHHTSDALKSTSSTFVSETRSGRVD